MTIGVTSWVDPGTGWQEYLAQAWLKLYLPSSRLGATWIRLARLTWQALAELELERSFFPIRATFLFFSYSAKGNDF